MSKFNEITEDNIREMLVEFYADCRKHPILSSIFEKYVGTDDTSWDEHIDIIRDFWVAVLLGKRGYSGNPMKVHDTIIEMRPEHFDMWLYTFQGVVMSMYDKVPAAKLIQASEKMSNSMQMALKRSGSKTFQDFQANG